MPFVKGSKPAGGKSDRKGTVWIRICLVDPKTGMPINGNRKEEFTIEDATVGDVHAAVNAVLFTEPPDDELRNSEDLTMP